MLHPGTTQQFCVNAGTSGTSPNIAYFVLFLFVKLAYIVSLAYAKAPGLIEIEGRCFILGGGRRFAPVAERQGCSVVSSPCLIISLLFPRPLTIDPAGRTVPAGPGLTQVRVRTLIRRLVRLRVSTGYGSRRVAVDFHDTSALGDASLPTNMLIKLMSKLGALSEVHTTVVS